PRTGVRSTPSLRTAMRGGERSRLRCAFIATDGRLVRAAQTLFPELDDLGWKFAHLGACAPACFGPHVEQGLVLAQALDRASLMRLGVRPELGFHPEKLDQRRDIPVGNFFGLPG